MIYLPKKVCLIIIHRNTAHFLDMSCCHKHQQQRYHKGNTKICMFIHYMYVHILFPLTKAIPIMFEHVTTHYLTLETSIGNNATHDGNAWWHVANSPRPGKCQRKYTVTRVVTRSSYGNALHYGLFMFTEFEKLPYPSVISISARFHKSFHLLLWNLAITYISKGSFTTSAFL